MNAVGEDAGDLGQKPVFNQSTALACRLVLVPQGGVGIEVAAGLEKVSRLDGG